MQINRWKQFQLLWKTKILKQIIEHPETAYKQIKKLEKKNTTINYTDPEARKSPNKEGKTQTGYTRTNSSRQQKRINNSS